MTTEEFIYNLNQKQLQKHKLYIAFCAKCGAYDHQLPRMNNNPYASNYFAHANCGGSIKPSSTITHEMFETLSPEQEMMLHQEIYQINIEQQKAHQEEDELILQRAHNEIERRNRGSHNSLIPDSMYKRTLLHDPADIPYCPQCDSLLVQSIRVKKRLFSAGLFGLASNTIGKSMECLSCKYKW